MLMAARGTVLDAFGEVIGLLPDNIGAHPPSRRLQRQRQPEGHEHQIFRAEAVLRSRRRWNRSRVCVGVLLPAPPCRRLGALGAGMAVFRITAPTSRIRIADIEPKGAVGAQYAPDLLKDLDQVGEIVVESRFRPQLTAPGAAPDAVAASSRAALARRYDVFLPSHGTWECICPRRTDRLAPRMATGSLATPDLGDRAVVA